MLQEAEGKLFEISQRNVKKEVTQIDPVISQAIEQIQAAANRTSGLSGLESGYHDLDKLTSGWQNSDLIIIAARPAMGKTAFVLSMAKNMAVNYNTPVAIFSLEMSNVQLVNRLISNVCEIEGSKIKSGQLTPIEWNQLMARIKHLSGAPLYIDDTPSLSIFELRTKARRLVREHGVRMIIIDYLQLMNASGRCMKHTMSASCSMAPDSRRSLSCGRLFSVRDSTLRLSCDRATMGRFSSFASCLSEREIMLTSCSRDPNFMPDAFMS